MYFYSQPLKRYVCGPKGEFLSQLNCFAPKIPGYFTFQSKIYFGHNITKQIYGCYIFKKVAKLSSVRKQYVQLQPTLP